MRYSGNFERDYSWYLKYKDQLVFDGTADTDKKVVFDEGGKSAKECFYAFDANGKIIPTHEPELLFQIHKAKGSINFNIKMWAEDRASGILPRIEFDKIIQELELLQWIIDAVERQKFKHYG